MKATKILSAAFIAAALVGCSQEEQFDMFQDGQMEFTGSFEQVNSRVTMDTENYMMEWENKDKVSIFPGITINNKYKVSSVTDGRASFAFEDYYLPEGATYVKTDGKINYALYPYADTNSIAANGTITANLPDSITYYGPEKSIKTALMAAKAEKGNLNFKNVQGILRLRLDALQPFYKVNSITLKSAKALSGNVTITFNANGLPEATMADNGGKTLTLNLSEGYQKCLERANSGKYSEFYIPVVPALYDEGELEMTIDWVDGEMEDYKHPVAIPVNIERRKIYTLYITVGANNDFGGDLEGAEEVWDGVSSIEPTLVTDDDTNETYYSITKASELAGFAAMVNGTTTLGRSVTTPETMNFKLEGNIDLGNYEWTPIGTTANPFTGIFDGDGFTIKNLTVTGYNSNVGLFGNTHDGEIKNLIVENAKVSGRLNVGVVSGQPYTSKYTNITVKGHVEVNGMAYVGGVGGKNAYANWENITVDVDASSYVNANSVEDGTAYRTYVGGVIGFNGEGSHSFKNITSNINVKGSTCDVGGLFGIAHYGNQFEKCHCTGNVEIYAASGEGEAQEIGGIAGVWNNGGEDVIFTNCTFEGELKANNNYVINTNKFGNLVCSAYKEDGAGKLIIDGVEYRQIAGGVVVFKDGVYEVDNAAELKNVVGFVEDGQTIKLTDNVTFDKDTRTLNSGTYYDGLYYIGDKSFTVDLNGKTIGHDGAVNDYLLNFKNDGAKANTITLKNGTINAGTAAYCALATSSSNAQKITINTENITFVNNNSNGATLKIRGGTELNVKAGTIIEGMNSYVGIEAVGNNTVVNIYDGAEIYQNGTSSYVGAIVGASYNATMNIYGGNGKSAKCGIIVMSTGATINVSGGEWIANNDGIVASDNNAVLVSQNNRNESGWACKSVLNVTGGTFKGGYNCYGMGTGVEPDDAQINIKGGNFNADPTQYVVAGYEVTGNYTVAKPQALVALEEAIAKGGNVTLTNDVTLLESLEITNKLVLDLNGKTITAPLFSAFEVKAGGDLTLKNGKVVAYESTVRAIGGKAIIESGEYISTGTALDTPSTYRYSLDCREGGELIINGGTFKSNNGMINVGSAVTINGGKFENVVEKSMTRHFAYVSAPLTINDGEFYGKANSGAGGCFFCGAAAGGDIQVNGGKFTSLWTSGSVNRIFEVYFGGIIKVTGGMFNTNGGIATFVTENTDEATKAAYPYVAK